MRSDSRYRQGLCMGGMEKRDKESLKAWFLSKGIAFCEGVKVVSCDMWEGFLIPPKKFS